MDLKAKIGILYSMHTCTCHNKFSGDTCVRTGIKIFKVNKHIILNARLSFEINILDSDSVVVTCWHMPQRNCSPRFFAYFFVLGNTA